LLAGVAVVASLPVVHQPITTARSAAIVGAGIEFFSVSVVTFFEARKDQAVAAERRGTGVGTSVLVARISVVALLISKLSFFDILAQQAVAAARQRAGWCAGVQRLQVTIVASLDTLVQLAIAATRRLAIVHAGIVF
jgi:hypothetical protein